MPWTPVPKFPLIIENLKKSGRKVSVGHETLENEIIRTTGVYTPKSVKTVIELMERLNYIKKIQRDDGVIIWLYAENRKEADLGDEEATIDKKLGEAEE